MVHKSSCKLEYPLDALKQLEWYVLCLVSLCAGLDRICNLYRVYNWAPIGGGLHEVRLFVCVCVCVCVCCVCV